MTKKSFKASRIPNLALASDFSPFRLSLCDFLRRLAQLEEELNIVAKNMKQLEFSEQEALEREQSYIEQIREITARVKEAEEKADTAEDSGARLQREVARLEEELREAHEANASFGQGLEDTLCALDNFE